VDEDHFDDLTRVLSGTRRFALRGALAVATGWLGVRGVDARKKRKHKRKKRKPKAVPNEYGCLEVGAPCTTVNQCCSGVCEGKKCRAHDTGTCDQQADGVCEAGNYISTLCNGNLCLCARTTAGSKFCGNFDSLYDSCVNCQRDADCAALGFPAGSACVPFVGEHEVCKSVCEDTGGMACLPPCGYVAPD
jgi:hypothetical protein